MYSLADDIPKESSRSSVSFHVPSFKKKKNSNLSRDGLSFSNLFHIGSKNFYVLLAVICICILGGVIIAVFSGAFDGESG